MKIEFKRLNYLFNLHYISYISDRFLITLYAIYLYVCKVYYNLHFCHFASFFFVLSTQLLWPKKDFLGKSFYLPSLCIIQIHLQCFRMLLELHGLNCTLTPNVLQHITISHSLLPRHHKLFHTPFCVLCLHYNPVKHGHIFNLSWRKSWKDG